MMSTSFSLGQSSRQVRQHSFIILTRSQNHSVIYLSTESPTESTVLPFNHGIGSRSITLWRKCGGEGTEGSTGTQRWVRVSLPFPSKKPGLIYGSWWWILSTAPPRPGLADQSNTPYAHAYLFVSSVPKNPNPGTRIPIVQLVTTTTTSKPAISWQCYAPKDRFISRMGTVW
jgi:hypothetical protein